MPTTNLPAIRACRPAWNKGRIIGQKRPLEPKHPKGGPIALSGFITLSHKRVASGIAFREVSLHVVPITELSGANAALAALGYIPQLTAPERPTWTTQIFAGSLSAHETLDAIRWFRAAGL